ncbi:MAG: DUF6463 family protein [Chromatiales bacterium]
MRGINGLVLVVIGLLHCLALFLPGAIGFPGIWSEILDAGLVDAVSGKALRIWGYYWFLMPGFVLIVLGMLCAWVERSLMRPVPAPVGWALVLCAVFGIVLDTDTGFWFVLFVAISMIVAAKRGAAARERT